METNLKFMNRFQKVEDALGKKGKTLEESTLEEMDAEWNAAKGKSVPF